MRVIKFRAWDGSQMINPYCELEDDKIFVGHDDMDTLEVRAVMQYTGMKDKNLNEIYECDIVKLDGHVHDYYIVEWGFFSWILRHHESKEKLLKVNHHMFLNSEVIGNIYSNPELLLTTK